MSAYIKSTFNIMWKRSKFHKVIHASAKNSDATWMIQEKLKLQQLL